MAIVEFPPVEKADPTGLLAIGGDLEVESLLLAYTHGIFPWPFDGRFIAWFAPPERAILFLDKVHYPRSLQKFVKKHPFTLTIDRNFPAVIEECSKLTNRQEQKGTWITKKMKQAYIEFHKAGYCHSFECYEGETLVGGLYGVRLKRMFAGESMFYRTPNASKLAFHLLCEHLKREGVLWIDCQMMTPLVESFGAQMVRREEYMKLLASALSDDSL